MSTLTKEIPGMFEGRILPVTLKLALPIFLSQLLQYLYTIVDAAFISQLDKSSTVYLSGVGLIFPVFFLFMALGVGLSTGISTMIARGIGEKNKDVIEDSADSGLLLSFIVVVIVIFLGYFFSDKIILLLAGSKIEPDTLVVSLTYFHYLIPGLALMLIINVFFGILQGEGLMKHIAIAMMISTISNIILDPILIFTAGMEVAGAALATSLSILISSFYVVYIFIRKKSSIDIKWNIFNARKKYIYEIIRIGFPQFIGMFALSITFLFLNKLVGDISQMNMNAFTLCGRIDHILLVPVFAVSAATMTMIGQNYGRNNLERIKKIYKTNVIFTLVIVLIIVILLNLLAELIFSNFSNVENVISYAVMQVRYLSFTFLGISVGIISAHTFQAIGKPIPALIIRAIRMGIIIIPVAYILVKRYHMGMQGIFISLGAGNIFVFFIALIFVSHYLKVLKFKKVAT